MNFASEEVQRLAWCGLIEEHERPHIWRRSALRLRPGHYGESLRAARRGGCPSAVKQIEKDLHRTFGSVHARGVRVPQAEALASLRNVLLAYAEHNPAIGYTQSMNLLVSLLLLVVDEETAFCCLATVVECVLPGHFAPDMAMSLIDGAVLGELLTAEDPELMAHLAELQARLHGRSSTLPPSPAGAGWWGSLRGGMAHMTELRAIFWSQDSTTRPAGWPFAIAHGPIPHLNLTPLACGAWHFLPLSSPMLLSRRPLNHAEPPRPSLPAR